MWTVLISLMKIRLLTLTWSIRYFYFQPHYEPTKAIQHEQSKISPLSCRNFRKFLENIKITRLFLHGVVVLLLFGKRSYIFFTYHKKSCSHSIFKTTNKPNSFSKVWKSENCDVVAQYRHSCYIRQYATRFLMKMLYWLCERFIVLGKMLASILDIKLFTLLCRNKMKHFLRNFLLCKRKIDSNWLKANWIKLTSVYNTAVIY